MPNCRDAVAPEFEVVLVSLGGTRHGVLVGEHLGLDLAAGDLGGADLEVGALADQQHVGELHAVALGGGQLLDLDLVPGAGAVLLATRHEYGVHDLVYLRRSGPGGARKRGRIL